MISENEFSSAFRGAIIGDVGEVGVFGVSHYSAGFSRQALDYCSKRVYSPGLPRCETLFKVCHQRPYLFQLCVQHCITKYIKK
jgi:hypothetical protein